tara:strand:+ start:211 stop:366 length:156 start_codon:yes stop_codon:yes gene_type:complete
MKHLPTMLPLLMTNSTAMAAGQNMPPIIPAGSAVCINFYLENGSLKDGTEQ